MVCPGVWCKMVLGLPAALEEGDQNLITWFCHSVTAVYFLRVFVGVFVWAGIGGLCASLSRGCAASLCFFKSADFGQSMVKHIGIVGIYSLLKPILELSNLQPPLRPKNIQF